MRVSASMEKESNSKILAATKPAPCPLGPPPHLHAQLPAKPFQTDPKWRSSPAPLVGLDTATVCSAVDLLQ